MRKIIALITGMALTASIAVSQGVQTLTTINGYNAYVYKPIGYENGGKFPLLLFFPGVGEAGTDASKLLAYGPSKYAPTLNPPGLVISVQPSYAWISPTVVNSVIMKILADYRVDTNRIVLTGLSAGGTNIEQYALTPAYSYKLAGIIPMSAPEVESYYPNIATVAPLPWKALGFSGTQDSHTEKMQSLFTRLGQASPGKTTFITGNYSHCCWNTFYNPTYKLPNTTQTLYDWAFSQNKSGGTTPPDTVVTPPVTPPAGGDSLVLHLPGKIEVEFRKDGTAIWKVIP